MLNIHLQCWTDPAILAKVDVVVTSYSIVSSEHASYAPSKDEGKKKSKKQTTLDDDDDDDSDDSLGKTIKKKAGKTKDALFRVKWWRIVLGT